MGAADDDDDDDDDGDDGDDEPSPRMYVMPNMMPWTGMGPMPMWGRPAPRAGRRRARSEPPADGPPSAPPAKAARGKR